MGVFAFHVFFNHFEIYLESAYPIVVVHLQ